MNVRHRQRGLDDPRQGGDVLKLFERSVVEDRL
jgi:hypothetical protein